MPNARVLVIDDDPMITQLLKEHLSNEGFDVTTVHLAEQGYKLATQSPPELILLDVMLPDATGYQMVGRFRENAITKSIPIIMMTGTARHANQQQIAKNMGANDYVLKPFDVIAVGDRVRELIKVKPEVEIESPGPIELVRHTEPVIFASEEPEPDTLTTPPTASPILSPAPVEMPDFATPQEAEPAREKPVKKSFGWIFALGMFALHLGITVIKTNADTVRALSFVAGGWALLLGLMMFTCAVFGMTLDAKDAFYILGWAGVPIVLRAMAGLAGFSSNALQLPSSVYGLRPLDIFEGAAMVILGIFFRKLRGSSLPKSLLAAFFMALVWCLTARGYFRPF